MNILLYYMVSMDHILKKLGLRKEEKYDNSLAIVPASYFSSLMLDIERKYIKGTTDTFATFEFNNYNMVSNNDKINIDDYEIDTDGGQDDGDELSKGDKIYLILDKNLVSSYPKKVHLFMGGSGGYYSYYLGIASILQKNFNLDNVIFSGVSGGTMVNLFLALNMDIEKVFDEWNIPLLETVSEYRLGALFNWNKTALYHFHKMIPEDAHQQVKGRYYVFSSEFHFFSKWKNKMLGDWDNNQELGKAILASCQVPILLGGNIYTFYKNQRFVDGCFTYYPKLNQYGIDMPSIKIYANSWRPYKVSWLWCWTSVEWHRKIYQWGQDDANKNLKYFKQFLMPK
jgi:hypothetical protein